MAEFQVNRSKAFLCKEAALCLRFALNRFPCQPIGPVTEIRVVTTGSPLPFSHQVCRFLVLVFLLSWYTPTFADPNSQPQDLVSIVRIDPDLTLVTNTHQSLVLEGLAPPLRPLFLPQDQSWPWRKSAQDFLREVALNREFQMRSSADNGASHQDRYGRWRVWLFPAEPDRPPSPSAPAASLQGQMISRGLGRVLPLPDATAGLATLLKLEEQARRNKIGVWQNWAYRLLTADDTRKAIGAYNLVEGRVKTVTRRPEATYLNFGDDWRRDFTVKIRPETRNKLAKGELQLSDLEGQDIRVRGWLFYENGPMIEVRQKEQIERLPR
ncbi:thermonuclease family protein [Rhodovibrionaceae bacterium A322]